MGLMAYMGEKRLAESMRNYYTPEQLQAMLPKVGDVLERPPTLHKSLGFGEAAPQPCVVEYVNAPHRWYMVRFIKTGIRQCYKLPRVTGQGNQQRTVPE